MAADLAAAFGDGHSYPWEMRNGYALATQSGLGLISQRLKNSDESQRDELRQLLRIGIQCDTEVTLPNCGHRVTQALCSALPVAYGTHRVELWEDAARLVLEASYEATICASIANYQRTGNNKAFLTFIGGGVFGNRMEWIIDAIHRAVTLYRHWPLDVALVCLKPPGERVDALIKGFRV